MGSVRNCTARYAGQESAGQAWLETDHLLFRGDFRVKISFPEMASVRAQDGALLVDFAGQTASFEMGSASVAATWAEKILHPKTVIDKMGIKPEMRVVLLGLRDPDFQKHLEERTQQWSADDSPAEAECVLFAAESVADLARIRELRKASSPTASIWIVYPRGRKDLKEADVLKAGRSAGLVDVKVTRFSDTHTATKFVRRKNEKGTR